MKRTITDSPIARRIAWFIGLWLASVMVLSGIAYLLHKIIIG